MANPGITIERVGAYTEEIAVATRGQGIGTALWDEMLAWIQEKHLDIATWTSAYTREDAHKFYIGKGAKILDTAPFVYYLPPKEII